MLWAVIGFFFFPMVGFGAEASKEALEHVADVSKATNFFTKWLAETYNTNKLVHTIACLVIMTIMGLVLAYLTEWLMGMLGYKAEKMEHKE
jgi:hypothetical protein